MLGDSVREVDAPLVPGPSGGGLVGELRVSFDPLDGDRIGEVSSARRDQGRASGLKGGAGGPATINFLDRTEAVRVDRAA